jgi:hypothetical protein
VVMMEMCVLPVYTGIASEIGLRLRLGLGLGGASACHWQ